MDIGARLRSLRTQYGISERALAAKVGIVASQINKIEHNVTKPSIDSLERICQALDITLGQFFTESELPPYLVEFNGVVKDLNPEQVAKLIEFIKTMK